MNSRGHAVWQLFWVFLRLGATSFGGPVAHIGYLRDEFVERRRWLNDVDYADLVALCQFLPGPASSQVVIGIGLRRAGVSGAIAASLGFTLPSLLLMVGLAYGYIGLGAGVEQAGWVHALKIAAAAVVAQAIWAMARTLCPDRVRGSIALAGAALLVVWPGTSTQLLVILAGGLAGRLFCDAPVADQRDDSSTGLALRAAVAMLGLFALLLAASLVASRPEGGGLALFSAMFQTGALVFGGGHVVLPLLEAETVQTGWVDPNAFLAGYGAAQALPGPLFTFAAFLGAVQQPVPNGLVGALIATTGIFLPSFLLVFGVSPLWNRVRANSAIRSALVGVNAAVVGLLLAVFVDPILFRTVTDGRDAALALVAFGLLVLWKWPAWLVVVGAGLGAVLVAALV